MKKPIQFMKYRFITMGLSIALAVVFTIGTIARHGFNMGIDFVGGVKVTAKFDNKINEGTIRSKLRQFDPSVQRFGQAELNEFIISTKGTVGQAQGGQSESALVTAIQQNFSGVEVLSVEDVGAIVGEYLRASALKLVLVSLVLMTVYLTFRFEFKYSVGAMVALVHDVSLSLLFCGFTGIEISIPIVAALATIFGFSVNDTIVIFDRIRENLQGKVGDSIKDVIDISVNHCLSRTYLTSLTVLFSVLTIYLLGSAALNDFAAVMLFGLVAGIYSTVYIASPVVYYWEKFSKK